MREAKVMMQQYCHRLNINPGLADDGFRLYRVAAMNNFTQGRRIPHVAAMCLYAACRKNKSNKVMLIDLADLCRANVFTLGRNYKALLKKFPDAREGYDPIIPEDLIFRFASKLEFFDDTNKVAYTAVRIAKRMQVDNMTHGRRPAGICGAALIMAARAHSYRRTVREVVYIAKITTHTLQLRMDEFANVPSAQLTIDEFHTNDFLEETADPPKWYKSTEVWKEKHPGRKRKATVVGDDGTPQPAGAEEAADKRQRTDDSPDSSPSAVRNSTAPPTEGAATNNVLVDPALLPSLPSPTPNANQQTVNTTPVTDKDGFVVPALPANVADRAMREEERLALVAARGGDGELQMLASEFGDDDAVPERSSEVAFAAAQGIDVASLTGASRAPATEPEKGKGKKANAKDKNVAFDEEWRADEALLEEEMEGVIQDPKIMSMAAEEAQKGGDQEAQERLEVYAEEARVNQEITAALEKSRAAADGAETGSAGDGAEAGAHPGPSSTSSGLTPWSRVKEDPIVTEDEFANDPEVMYCKLGEKEIEMKMQIWVNENEDWMRENQKRLHQKRLAAKGPPKKTRNRTRVPRIGEGQASPASSAGEAAVSQLKMRAVSKKINYQMFENIFSNDNDDYHRPDSVYGGTNTAMNSRAPSAAPSETGSQRGETHGTAAKHATRSKGPVAATTASAPVADMQEADEEVDDDMHDYDEEHVEEDQDDYDPFAVAGEDQWE
jgi:transcription factor IIIB subunit 2